MTDEFKDKLLKYFTGNLQEGTTPYTFYQSDMSTNINNLYNTLSSEIGNQYTGGFDVTGVLQAKTTGDNNLNVYILYGTANGSTKHTYDFGYIVLIDEEFNIIDILTEYSSGVVIGPLDVLNVDENGYLYGIEKNYNDTQKRFIMLNNVALKLANENYQVKIRRAYNLPFATSGRYYGLVKKEPNGNKYLFAGTYYVSSISTPFAVELEIVVGSPNTWTWYEYSSAHTLSGAATLDLWATWTGGTLDFEILGLDMNTICIFYKNSTAIDVNTYTFVTNDTIYDISGKMYQKDYAFLGIITLNAPNYMEHFINVIEPGQSNLINIYQKKGGYYGTTTAAASDIDINGLDIYYTEMIRDDDDNYNCESGRIIVNNGYELIPTINVTALSGPRYYFNRLFVTKQNNLYIWYLQVENYVYMIKETFNLTDYNLVNIDNSKFFIPKTANLYDNHDIIYSKNLYNVAINDNITTSTVEISNLELNNLSIESENLVGSTYENLVEAGVEFTKNQYEIVDINFINTLNIQNKNNETIQEIDGQNRLNNSISSTADYLNAKMTKIRINFKNNTSVTKNIQWYKRGNYYNTVFTLGYILNIKNVEIISEDEQTTYMTIDREFPNGHQYIVSQDVYIAPKLPAQQVYYNTDEVYYNTDEVYN